MNMPIRHTPPDDWIRAIFSANAVLKGGVVRRQVSWVEREIGRERFELEVRRRGYRLLECGGQYVVICNSDPVRMIC